MPEPVPVAPVPPGTDPVSERTAADEGFMRHALAAAQAVAGQTGDNPPVGCVVVHEARVVASGGTQPPGGAHAEVMAVRQAQAAGVPLNECTLYVTLEPCAFHGRTPPCTDLLLACRPRRVVIGLRDPHPRVRGRGLAALRAGGIPVDEGVLVAEIRPLLASWLQRYP